MALERLDKLLASTGRWSRKEVKDLVRQGRVLANGRPVLRSEEKWEQTETELTVDGQRVDCAPFVYLMLHKPAGLLSATEDRDQRTVLDLLPEHLRRRGLFPVGRLDKDTEGLLLLTDDGPLGHALLSPNAMWTRCIWPVWTVWWIRATWRPWPGAWCWETDCTACPPGWSRWRMAGSAWSPCGRGSTTR